MSARKEIITRRPYILRGVQRVDLPKLDPELEYPEFIQLVSPQIVRARIRGLAEEIMRDYKGKRPFVLVTLANGGVFLAVDLMREFAKHNFHVQFQIFDGSRYNDDEKPNKNISFSPEPSKTKIGQYINDLDDEPKPVILCDDIADEAISITRAKEYLNSRGFKIVETVVLADKGATSRAQGLEDFVPDRTGFLIPNLWVAESGMDTKVDDVSFFSIGDYNRLEDRYGLLRGGTGIAVKTANVQRLGG